MTEPVRRVDWLAALTEGVTGVTPARIFTGRAGTSYLTASALRLRADHAVARDAVESALDLTAVGVSVLTGGRQATVVTTDAPTRPEYLRRPDLGRRLSASARASLSGLRRGADLQLVLGDGLSAAAVLAQAPELLTPLITGAEDRGWSVGDLVVISQCRVGVLNDLGELLDATVVVLLIGERPGLGNAESLSAYLAHRPRPGDTDARRNLVSNIHGRGLSIGEAAERILALADAMRAAGTSGVAIKETDRLALPPHA